jgi:hypothetical protein
MVDAVRTADSEGPVIRRPSRDDRDSLTTTSVLRNATRTYLSWRIICADRAATTTPDVQ